MSEIIQKYRYLERFLPESKSRKLVILTGARQTGKTTLAKSKYSKLNYIKIAKNIRKSRSAGNERNFKQVGQGVAWRTAGKSGEYSPKN